MSFSIVIPSRNAANLVPCVRCIREAGETARIIVVDDGLDRSYVPWWKTFRDWVDVPSGIQVITGVKPFVFARNVNIGIQAAGDDDVILLNDDALLKTPHGFSELERVMRLSPLGLLSSTCNNVGNANQFRQKPRMVEGQEFYRIRHEERMVCFVCVYIPRSTINAVGLLDKRFVGYGLDDDDYCMRVRNAGLKIGIFDGCFVDHGSLTSSFRGAVGAGGDFKPNLALFIEKWGFDNRGLSYEQSPWKRLWRNEE